MVFPGGFDSQKCETFSSCKYLLTYLKVNMGQSLQNKNNSMLNYIEKCTSMYTTHLIWYFVTFCFFLFSTLACALQLIVASQFIYNLHNIKIEFQGSFSCTCSQITAASYLRDLLPAMYMYFIYLLTSRFFQKATYRPFLQQ